MGKAKTIIRWGIGNFGPWRLCLAASERGLVYADRLAVSAADGGQTDSSEAEEAAYRELAAWLNRRIPDAEPVRDDQALKPYASQYEEYARGERTSFNFALDLYGTPFQREVWKALAEIPHGRTCAYSDIAERIGKPSAVRACGGAIGKNPVLIAIPCHRVIGKDGSLTGFGGGLDLKAWLLDLETGKKGAATGV